MNPFDLFAQTAAHHFGGAMATRLTNLLRAVLSEADAKVILDWLSKKGFFQSLAVQWIASINVADKFVAMGLLPGGITALQINEMWEEVVEGIRAGMLAGNVAPPPPPDQLPSRVEQVTFFVRIIPQVLPEMLGAAWPWAACTFVGAVFVCLAFAMKAERRAGGMLGWFTPAVIAEARPWLKFAKLATAISVLALLGTLVRSMISAPQGRVFDRARLILPVLLSFAVVPFTALCFTAALDVAIFTARLEGAPLRLVLPLIAMADRYAIMFDLPNVAWLLIWVGGILIVDKFADTIAEFIQRTFRFGSGNVPIQMIARAVKVMGVGILLLLNTLHLAITRWPDPQMVADFLMYGIGLEICAGMILLGVGFATSPTVRKWLAVAFVLVVTLTTLYVWYQTRHPGMIEGVTHDGVLSARQHTPYIWRLIVSEWRADQTGDWLTVRFLHGALWLTLGLVILAIANALLSVKSWNKFWSIPLGLAAIFGIVVPSVFHVIAIIFSWLT